MFVTCDMDCNTFSCKKQRWAIEREKKKKFVFLGEKCQGKEMVRLTKEEEVMREEWWNNCFFFYAKTGKDKKQFSIAQSVTQELFISTTDALVIKSL